METNLKVTRALLVDDHALFRESVARVEAHFTAVGLPISIADVPGTEGLEPETLLGIMGQDKKVRAGRLTLILARAIGEAFVTRDVPAPLVRDFLSRQIART